MKSIQFKDVPLGTQFKESVGGHWHLKSSCNKGTYQRFGTRYEPNFKSDELVFVEAPKTDSPGWFGVTTAGRIGPCATLRQAMIRSGI